MGTLVKVTILVLSLFALALSTINIYGQSQQYQAYDFVFYQQQEKFKITPWEQAYLVEQHPDWILWVDVYLGENQQLLAKPWIERSKTTAQLDKVASPTRPRIAELLEKHPQSRFILNITDNVMDIHTIVLQMIEQTGAEKRILLQSPYNVIMSAIKDKKPLMVFGSTLADVTRLKVHESMWILSAAPFKGDVFVTELMTHGRPNYSPAILKELKRRFKRVFLGPLKNKDEIQLAESLDVDGLFVEDPLLLL